MLIEQVKLWEAQHIARRADLDSLLYTPNNFAIMCANYLPHYSRVVEIGTANGRDARFFARSKQSRVLAVDFSRNALDQLVGAAVRI